MKKIVYSEPKGYFTPEMQEAFEKNRKENGTKIANEGKKISNEEFRKYLNGSNK